MAEKIMTLAFLAVSAIYLFESYQLTFGTLSAPKSGFLPVLTGIAAAMLSLVLIIGQVSCKKLEKRGKADWTKFVFLILGLLFYVVLFNMLGYFATTFILLLYLFKVADSENWLAPLILAAGSSTALYLLFQKFLGVVLP